MRSRSARVVALAACWWVPLVPLVAPAQGMRFPLPLELRVPTTPALLSGGGAHTLEYELHLTNLSTAAVTIRRLEVLDDGDGRLLLALEDSALARALLRVAMAPQPAVAERARIAAGLRGIVFLSVPVATHPPARVRHRLTITTGNGDSVATHAVAGGATGVAADAAVVAPPLRGGPWLAANGPGAPSGHRRALIVAGDRPTIAQRFAIDYVMLDSSGRTFAGDRLRNESYHAHGQDALAVADGIIALVKDSIPENIPGATSRAVPITLETVGGNFVILDIGGGRFAFYAHLQPGSLRVKVGDRVRRGQRLGLVGNSGNSTEPHLHFHLADAPSALGAEGAPYVHERFEVAGRCRATLAGCVSAPPQVRRREMPLGGMIVHFPR